MTKSTVNRKSGPSSKAKKTARVAKNVLSKKPDGDFPNPDQTLKQSFDLNKADLLRAVRSLLSMVSNLELDDYYDEDEDYLHDELMEARDIVRRLTRIEHLKCIIGS